MLSMLVCTDGSPVARTAVRYARHLAEAMGLQVRVLFVEDVRHTQGPLLTGYYGPVGMAPSPAYPAFYDELVKAVKEQGERAVQEAREVFEGSSASVEYVVREGIVRDCILDEARTVDLVCMGRRGEHEEWEEDELGGTAERVIRRSARPVLVTPAEFREISKMLMAYDGSRGANRALRTALALASDHDLPMVIVTVSPDDDARPRYERILEEARELASAWKDVELEFLMLVGETEEQVLTEAAATHECQLIVMGAYGESRIREWLMGSTTAAVLAHASLPVLLVR